MPSRRVHGSRSECDGEAERARHLHKEPLTMGENIIFVIDLDHEMAMAVSTGESKMQHVQTSIQRFCHMKEKIGTGKNTYALAFLNEEAAEWLMDFGEAEVVQLMASHLEPALQSNTQRKPFNLNSIVTLVQQHAYPTNEAKNVRLVLIFGRTHTQFIELTEENKHQYKQLVQSGFVIDILYLHEKAETTGILGPQEIYDVLLTSFDQTNPASYTFEATKNVRRICSAWATLLGKPGQRPNEFNPDIKAKPFLKPNITQATSQPPSPQRQPVAVPSPEPQRLPPPVAPRKSPSASPEPRRTSIPPPIVPRKSFS
jgi:hypothetical protein